MARTVTSATTTVTLITAASVLCVARSHVHVMAPSAGETVVAGRSFPVEWTGTKSSGGVDVDLHYCGGDCDDLDWCGDWVTSLCSHSSGLGCTHDDGELEVIMPEPSLEDGMYRVLVTDGEDESNTGCSAAFTLVNQDDASASGVDGEGSLLNVISPREKDGAIAGEGYTVEWNYENRFGTSSGRFKIDLYLAEGLGGDCGQWVSSICNKPDIGCMDTAGDYDVVIPQDIQAAMYSIRVGLFSDDSVFGCSGTFSVVSDPSLYLPSSQDSMSYTFEYEEDFGRDGDWWRASDFEGPATSLFDDDYVDSLVGDLSYAFSYDN